jgi:hypothetical protein
MSSLDLCHNNLTTYIHHSGGHWNDESQPPPLPSSALDDMNAIYYAYPQNDTGSFPRLTPIPSFSPLYAPSIPANTLSNLQPTLSPQPFMYNHSTSHPPNPVSTLHIPAHNPSMTPDSSPVQPTPTTSSMTPSASVPPQVHTSSTSQRAKFPCTLCGKLCTSRPRADTCFFNHIGAKPFGCNGGCGRVNW